jgi:hypothetical protein
VTRDRGCGRPGNPCCPLSGHPSVNNASFGAYAEIVDNPAYGDDKRATTLDALPDLLSGRRGAQGLVGRGG